jgi:hypothetical protein
MLVLLPCVCRDGAISRCEQSGAFNALVPYNNAHTFEDYAKSVKLNYKIDHPPIWHSPPTYTNVWDATTFDLVYN